MHTQHQYTCAHQWWLCRHWWCIVVHACIGGISTAIGRALYHSSMQAQGRSLAWSLICHSCTLVSFYINHAPSPSDMIWVCQFWRLRPQYYAPPPSLLHWNVCRGCYCDNYRGYECRDFSVAPVDMKWWRFFSFLTTLIDNNLSDVSSPLLLLLPPPQLAYLQKERSAVYVWSLDRK